jgi:uncharacterized membrane protein
MNDGMLLGVGLGAGLMYLFDPERGRRRRALLRDRLTSTGHHAAHQVNVTARDIGHRAAGLIAETRHEFMTEHPSDRVVAERVRSRIGRAVSHPHAIQVDVSGGRVTLSGPILAREVDDLLACVSTVRGVAGVESRLDVHEQPGRLSALQGGRVFLRGTSAKWSPVVRVLACAAGGGLMANCLIRRTPGAALLGTAGFALFLRGLTNVELRRLAGLRRGNRWTEVRKAVVVHAPVEEVFGFWTHYANFPRFMAHLREVRDLGDGRSYWVAVGPAGVTATWTAAATRVVPDELLAWRTEPGSMIPNAGVVRFERIGGESTRVEIRLAYRPPAGALGHFAARLFGADPKSALDEDLVRFKSLLENGSASAPGKRATRQELVGRVAHNGPAAPVIIPGGQGI